MILNLKKYVLGNRTTVLTQEKLARGIVSASTLAPATGARVEKPQPPPFAKATRVRKAEAVVRLRNRHQFRSAQSTRVRKRVARTKLTPKATANHTAVKLHASAAAVTRNKARLSTIKASLRGNRAVRQRRRTAAATAAR